MNWHVSIQVLNYKTAEQLFATNIRGLPIPRIGETITVGDDTYCVAAVDHDLQGSVFLYVNEVSGPMAAS